MIRIGTRIVEPDCIKFMSLKFDLVYLLNRYRIMTVYHIALFYRRSNALQKRIMHCHTKVYKYEFRIRLSAM